MTWKPPAVRGLNQFGRVLLLLITVGSSRSDSLPAEMCKNVKTPKKPKFGKVPKHGKAILYCSLEVVLSRSLREKMLLSEGWCVKAKTDSQL